MGIVFRQSVKNFIVVGLGAALGALIIWLSTKYVPRQQYGFIGSLTNYAVTFGQIMLLGLNSTLVVYIHRFAGNKEKSRLLVTLSLLIPLVAAALFTLLLQVFRQPIIQHFQPVDRPFMSRYFLLMPLFTLLFIYMVLLEQYLGSQLKVAAAAFMREVVLRVLNVALILLFGFGIIDFHVLVIATVLIYLVPLAVFFLLSMRTSQFGFSLRIKDFSRAEYKDMAQFTWFHFLLTTSVLFLGSMDVMLIPIYDPKGLTSVAVFRVTMFLVSFLQIPLRALLPASFSVMARAFADGEHEKAAGFFRRSSLNILIPTVAVAALLFANLTNVVTVIKNGYTEIVPLFCILFIGNMVNICLGMTDQVLTIANYYRFNFYLSLILIAVLFLSLRTFIPLYGIYGAAWSTSMCLSVFNIIKYLFVSSKLRMRIQYTKTFLVLGSGTAALAAGYFFPHMFDQSRHTYVRTFLDVVMRSTVVMVVYGGLLLWLQPSDDMREYLAQVRRNKRLF